MKKEKNKTREENYSKQPITNDGHRHGSYLVIKPHKSKIKSIKYDVFDIGSIKNAAWFTKSLMKR